MKSACTYRRAAVGALGLCLSAALHAQSALPAESECELRIATGPETGVYTRLGRDINAVCGKVVKTCVVPTKGGLQNLSMLSASEADIGFAQVDLLAELGRGGDPSIRQLQAVMPMHTNLLHLVTLKRGSKVPRFKITGDMMLPGLTETKVFSKFSDLRNAQVALVGSAVLMGQSLDKQLGYAMSFVEANNEDEAFGLLRAGKVQAVFLTGGWPYRPITAQDSNGDLMLATSDVSVVSPLVTVKRNYPNLGAYGHSFIAAPNLLLTRPFKAGGEKSRQLDALRRCITSHMDELQEGAYSNVWQEIKDTSDTMGVPVFRGNESSKVLTRK